MDRERTRSEKRRIQVMKQKMILSGAAFALVMSCSVLTSGFMTSAHDKAAVLPTTKSYKCIQIESGDSLWSIAETYKAANQSVKEYIKEIKNLNSLKSDDIHEDQYLTVTCYETKLM